MATKTLSLVLVAIAALTNLCIHAQTVEPMCNVRGECIVGVYSNEKSTGILTYDDCLAFCRDEDPDCDYFNFKEYDDDTFACVTFTGTCPDVR